MATRVQKLFNLLILRSALDKIKNTANPNGGKQTDGSTTYLLWSWTEKEQDVRKLPF